MSILMFINLKAGVAKSTNAVALAERLAPSATGPTLSDACHYHPYELAPTAGELGTLFDTVGSSDRSSTRSAICSAPWTSEVLADDAPTHSTPMLTTTAWLKPPLAISGQDHLATMAPAVTLYSQLVPGITNVTQRARAYSFYPWLLWEIERAGLPRDPESLVKWVRSAECLWCLIGFSHGGDGDPWEHGGGITGRDQLGHAWDSLEAGQSVRLSKYATPDVSADRYFKGRLGGLGTYYLATLSELRIVSGDATSGLRYDEKRGGALAKALADSVDGSLFLRTLQGDQVSPETLRQLSGFCPCHLRSSRAELDLLRDLFFNAPGMFWSEADESRPRTLRLLLHLAGALEAVASEGGLGLQSFRGCVYSGGLERDTPWVLPGEVEGHRLSWATYERAELLSLAVQGVFWVALAAFEKAGERPATSRQAAQWLADHFAAKAFDLPEQPFSRCLADRRPSLPALHDWRHPAHEIQLARVVFGTNEESDAAEMETTLRASLGVLLALTARSQEAAGAYAPFALDPDYFERYPVNLTSLQDVALKEWQRLTAREWLAWLVRHWGIDLHLRVALRKLRYESRDTFRVRPADEGLEVVEADYPARTTPRLSRAMQMLRDLGLLDMSSDSYVLTADGRHHLQDLAH